LTRNPFFLSFTLLDAGSSPAWQTEIKRFFELGLRLFRGNEKLEMEQLPIFLNIFITQSVMIVFGRASRSAKCLRPSA
jgi:hypothetical protein